MYLGWLLFFSLLTSIKPPSVCLELKNKKKKTDGTRSFPFWQSSKSFSPSNSVTPPRFIHTQTRLQYPSIFMERKNSRVSSVCLRLCSTHTQYWRAAKSRPLLCNTASLLPHSLGSNSLPSCCLTCLVLFFFFFFFQFLVSLFSFLTRRKKKKKKNFLFFSAVVGHPYGNGFKSQVVGVLANQIQWLWWNELCWIHIYGVDLHTPDRLSLSL